MKVPRESPTTHFEVKSRRIYTIQTVFTPMIKTHRNFWTLDASPKC